MPVETFKVGVLARSHPPSSRWATRMLHPFGVLALVPETAPGTFLGEEDGVETWYLGAHDLTLYSGDTGHHRDNLTSQRPSVWVALSGADKPATVRVRLVTADPYEGGGLADDPALVVEAVPMPDLLRAPIEAFIAAHHVEEVFRKRKRQPVDPDAAFSARAPRILREEDKWGRR
jgi:hypothetical protein